MSPDLTGRRVLVTGGAGGIGSAIVAACAEAGAQVASADLRSPEHPLSNVSYLEVDLATADGNVQALDDTRAALGGVDAIVAAAGFQHVAPVESFPIDVWQQMLSVMLTSPFMLARNAWPDLVAHGDGRFVAISSIHGLRASPHKAGYVAAKHGLVGLTRALAIEGAEDGISAVALCPAFVRTPLVERQVDTLARESGLAHEAALEQLLLAPQARKTLIDPREVAAVVLFLLGPEGRAFTGSALTMDQGWSAR